MGLDCWRTGGLLERETQLTASISHHMCERGYSRPLGLSESAGRMQPSEQPQARPEESANKTVVVLSLWVSGGLVCYITTANRAPPESLLELQNLKPPLQTY